MEVLVLGVEEVSYTSRKTGNPVSGMALHSAYVKPGTMGQAVERVFISDNVGIRKILKEIQPDSRVDIHMDFRGNVVDVVPIG